MLTIAGVGEALFDIFPNGARKLGGATLNFAVHGHQLLARVNGRGIPVTRIGTDSLGDEVVANLEAYQVPTANVQRDATRPTGQVLVTFCTDGSPNYEILRDVAWDAIEFDSAARGLAPQCGAVCFGTLAQRDPRSAKAIQAFIEAAPADALRLLDINLRQKFYNETLIRRSLELANALKINDTEIDAIAPLLRIKDDLPASLICQFDLRYLILTRGEHGTVIHTENGIFEGDRIAAVPNEDADPVGAGDSCAAACAVGLLLNHAPASVATFANRVGAYVASHPGGTPKLPETLLVKPDCTLPL
jgi:fructokinase